MTILARERAAGEVPDAIPPEDAGAAEAIAGDRGIPSINRARSLQSRLSSVLAIGLMSALGLGLLTWYYARTLTRPVEVQHAAQAAVKSRAQGEMTLPPLPPMASPFVRPDAPPATVPDARAERLLGPAPPYPVAAAGEMPVSVAPAPASTLAAQKSPGQLALERRLGGPAFARGSSEGTSTPTAPVGVSLDPASPAPVRPGAGDAASGSTQTLATLLRPTVMPAVAPSVLATQRLLLAKGTFIDCTLETAIDSTLPGMTTCITATDTFSADGAVVLIERGTKLVGETRGEAQQGSPRIFVLWTEARTPTGIVVPLDAPGTDELGRSGLPGEVNRHFWDRFGAAILLTVINGAVQGAVNSQNSSGSVVVSPGAATDVMSEVLRSTVSIPQTVTKAQGDRIQVFVARDVDFRSVYALRVAHAVPSPDPKP